MRAHLAAILAGALATALAACGGGGSTSTVQPNPPPGPATSTSKQSTSTGKDGSAHTPETPTTSSSPEDKPGGAGDETPARFDASLTGRGGSIGPRQVQVAPYISVRVLLRSADGQHYQLRVNGKTLAARA
ncbi:MAG: hypothetical protein ACJ76M_03460, partial [Solirubrobacteraceae bacterium]